MLLVSLFLILINIKRGILYFCFGVSLAYVIFKIYFVLPSTCIIFVF